MNLNCNIDTTYNILIDTSSFQDWSVTTDSSGAEGHVFKYAIPQEYIDTTFPQVKIANETSTATGVMDTYYEHDVSIVMELTDSPDRYVDGDGEEITNVSELLYLFQGQVDLIIGEFLCNAPHSMGIKSISMVSGPDMASFDVDKHQSGRILNSLYRIEYGI